MNRLQAIKTARTWRVPGVVARRLKHLSVETGETCEQLVTMALERFLDDRDNAREQDVRTFVGAGE